MSATKPSPSSPRISAKAAERLLSQAIDLFAAQEAPVPPEAIKSAGIPITGGKTMLDAQKFRVNWYGLERKQLGRIARLCAERNWFAGPVLRLNKAIYGGGFKLKAPDARKWAAEGTYPFKRIHDDLLHEYLVSDAAVAFWRTDAESGMIPMIEVPNMEDVDYEVIGGVPRVWITVAKNSRIDDKLKAIIGEKMWTAIKTGKPLILTKGDDTTGYDFELIKEGKSTGQIQPPSITGILDDLDYIEGCRVGDWNGVWSRREIIRHTQKGYGVSSGPNAGTARNNAKYAELQAILVAMKNILGKTDVATNFDQTIDWLTFPSEFFSPEMRQAALQRLIFWGGLAAIMLLKTDSQITGMSAFLHDRVRCQVEWFRESFAPFLGSIFNSESFKKNFPSAPDLSVAWNVKSLYTGDALVRRATFSATYAMEAPSTIREMFGVDDETESARMLEAHAKREQYTPPYEPRQGLLPMLSPEDYNQPPATPSEDPPPPAKPAKKTAKSKLPGTPGRPGKES